MNWAFSESSAFSLNWSSEGLVFQTKSPGELVDIFTCNNWFSLVVPEDGSWGSGLKQFSNFASSIEQNVLQKDVHSEIHDDNEETAQRWHDTPHAGSADAFPVC